MSNKNIRGIVHLISRTYGLIEGDNGVHYFFMPTDVLPPSVFRDLVPRDREHSGTRVEGEPYKHKGRDRMRDIVVVVPDQITGVTHGAAG